MDYRRLIGIASLWLLGMPSQAANLDDSLFAPLGMEPELPSVLTPARLKQPQSEVPASVTVIDRAMIQASGIRALPELLRLVPGMAVASRDGWEFVASYHGTNYRDSRRMQVMIDGRSVYQPGLAQVKWTDLPISLSDIERIEVTRGPNSVTYGANAFVGIVHIITRHSEDTAGTLLSTLRGENGVEDYLLRHGQTSPEVSWRITAQARHDNGFERAADRAGRRDSQSLHALHGRLDLHLGQASTLSVQAGYKSGVNQEVTDDPFVITPTDREVKDSFLHFLLNTDSGEHTQWQVQYYLNRTQTLSPWGACLPAAYLLNYSIANPAQVVCGEANEDLLVQRHDLELEITHVVNAQHRFVGGLGLRQDSASSETYYSGKVDADQQRIFAQWEARWHEQLLTNLGATWENEQGLGDFISPRLGINWHLTPSKRHTVRFVYSEAIRTPDLFETQASWGYRVRNLPADLNGHTSGQFALIDTGNPNLQPERVTSREIGYFGQWPEWQMTLDLRLFHDNYRDLISDGFSFGSFNPENDQSLQHEGAEISLDWRHDNLRVHLNYSYIDVADRLAHAREASLTPTQSGSLTLIADLGDGFTWSGNYYYANPINNVRKFSRLDMRLAKRWRMGEYEMELAGIVRQRLDHDGDLFEDNLYRDRTHTWLNLQLEF